MNQAHLKFRGHPGLCSVRLVRTCVCDIRPFKTLTLQQDLRGEYLYITYGTMAFLIHTGDGIRYTTQLGNINYGTDQIVMKWARICYPEDNKMVNRALQERIELESP